MTKEEYDKRYREILESNGYIDEVIGVFSSKYPDLAHIEEQKVTDKGKITKYIGCHAWHKVKTDRELHNDATALKGAYFETALFALKIGILIPVLLTCKKQVLKWAYGLYRKRLAITIPKETHFSPMGQELIRVGKSLNPYKIKGIKKNSGGTPDLSYEPKHWFDSLVMALVAFVETSSTYYVITQDLIALLGELGDIMKVLRTCRRRHRNKDSKIMGLIVILNVVLMFPRFKRVARKIIRSIDYERCEHDDDDMYFAFRMEDYDTFDSYPGERRKWVEEVDKENKNLILHEMR